MATKTKAKRGNTKMAKQKKNTNGNVAWLKQRWIVLAVMLSFAGVGVYTLAFSSAATQYYVSFLAYQCPTLPTLRTGSTGDCVKAVQKGLNNRNENFKLRFGLAYTPLAVNGIYGTATTAAVRKYQSTGTPGVSGGTGAKRPADGVFGSATWDKFLNDCWVFSDPTYVGWHQDKGGNVYYPPGYLCQSLPGTL